jgi:hypothetical protein
MNSFDNSNFRFPLLLKNLSLFFTFNIIFTCPLIIFISAFFFIYAVTSLKKYSEFSNFSETYYDGL